MIPLDYSTTGRLDKIAIYSFFVIYNFAARRILHSEGFNHKCSRQHGNTYHKRYLQLSRSALNCHICFLLYCNRYCNTCKNVLYFSDYILCFFHTQDLWRSDMRVSTVPVFLNKYYDCLLFLHKHSVFLRKGTLCMFTGQLPQPPLSGDCGV